MIKRQFYSLEHRSRDSEASSASSSSSSSALEGAASSSADDAHSPAYEQEKEEEEDEEVPSSSGPSFEVSNEDKGATDINLDLAAGFEDPHDYDGHPRNTLKKRKNENSVVSNQWADLVSETLNEQAVDFADDCVMSCKKVLKCRLCPKTICLSRESMQAHLTSKKHGRSLKLLSEGRLKVMLNSDGEEEEQGETHAERHARILASFKEDIAKPTPQKRKGASGRQRQRKRAKKKGMKSADG